MPDEKKEKTIEQRVADLERTADAAVTIAKKIAAVLFKQFGIKILGFALCAFMAMPALAVDTLFNPVGSVYTAGTFKVIAESQSSTVTCKTDVVVASTVQCTTLNATTISGSGNQVVSGTLTANGNTVLGGTLGASNTVTFTTNLIVNGTTASTSKDTGAIVTEGGLGVEKSAYIGTGLYVNSKAVAVSTNATARMICSITTTNTSGAQSITLPVPFAGTTVPLGVGGFQEDLPAPLEGTNWNVSVLCTSNSVSIRTTGAPAGGAGTNISVIIHGVAP